MIRNVNKNTYSTYFAYKSVISKVFKLSPSTETSPPCEIRISNCPERLSSDPGFLFSLSTCNRPFSTLEHTDDSIPNK